MSEGDSKMKHLPVALLYGFISLVSFLKADMSAVSFESFMLIVSWIALIAMIYCVQWFDTITDGYLILTLLLFLAARLARYSAMTIATPATYIAIGIGMGLIAQCIVNNKGWPAVWLAGIFAIEICAMELETGWKSDMSSVFPPIDFIDSNFTLDIQKSS